MSVALLAYVFIVHSINLFASDWTRGVQLILNCTLREYQLQLLLSKPKFPEVVPKTSEHNLRLSKTSEGRRSWPKIFEVYPRCPDDVRS